MSRENFSFEGDIHVRPAWGLIELADGEKLDSALALQFGLDDGAPWRARVRISVELLDEPEQMGLGDLVPCVPGDQD